MKIQCVFTITGQLEHAFEWDTAKHPDLPDKILELIQGNEPEVVVRHPTGPRALAQVTPESQEDPYEKDGVEKAGGRRQKALDRVKVTETRQRHFKRMGEEEAKIVMGFLLENAMPFNEIADACDISLQAVTGLAGGKTFIRITGFEPWTDRDPDNPYHARYYNREGNGKINSRGHGLRQRFAKAYITGKQRSAQRARAARAAKKEEKK